MLRSLLFDESGFIVTSELVLVSTILVIGMIVGLNQVQYAVAEELKDIGQAIGGLQQSYYFTGFSAVGSAGGVQGRMKSHFYGSFFRDSGDCCDNNPTIACDAPVSENEVIF